MTSISFADFSADYSCAVKAIRAALAAGLQIDKRADPSEGERYALSEEEAIEVAEQDASLLVLRVYLSAAQLASDDG